METSVLFKMYCVAVLYATQLSKGDGQINNFDKVANQLFEEGWDEKYYDVPAPIKQLWSNQFGMEVAAMASAYQ